MMLVSVRVAPSRIHGLGLFSTEFVPRGAPIWRFEPGFDQTFSSGQLALLPAGAQAHLRWFGWVDRLTSHWVLSGDHACFMNHDPRPNTGVSSDSLDRTVTIALRDISAGEELTCDYHAFDAEAEAKLGSAAQSYG
ncbi:MAG TPA: SET domain-containing protein-lysine N-methyltransferase [Verrucomicrobiales bacterium]|nr:SET domain-containing protein-lysine N-methyltransferase [Verrucomicrobiales bacterium]